MEIIKEIIKLSSKDRFVIPPKFTGKIEVYLDEIDGDSYVSEYYLDGKYHRIDGPAIIYPTTGRGYWYLYGENMSAEHHFNYVLEHASDVERDEILFNLDRWTKFR